MPRKGEVTVSVERIYQHIYCDYDHGGTFYEHLCQPPKKHRRLLRRRDHRDVVSRSGTDAIIMFSEISGNAEKEACAYIKEEASRWIHRRCLCTQRPHHGPRRCNRFCKRIRHSRSGVCSHRRCRCLEHPQFVENCRRLAEDLQGLNPLQSTLQNLPPSITPGQIFLCHFHALNKLLPHFANRPKGRFPSSCRSKHCVSDSEAFSEAFLASRTHRLRLWPSAALL
jgi:hypothetical protein